MLLQDGYDFLFGIALAFYLGSPWVRINGKPHMKGGLVYVGTVRTSNNFYMEKQAEQQRLVLNVKEFE